MIQSISFQVVFLISLITQRLGYTRNPYQLVSEKTPVDVVAVIMSVSSGDVELRRNDSSATMGSGGETKTKKSLQLSFRKATSWAAKGLHLRSKSSDRKFSSEPDEPRYRRAISMSPSTSKKLFKNESCNTLISAKTYMPYRNRPCLPPTPAPLLIEDPPSSENVSDLEEVKHPNDPALLNGSSGNFGSAGAARSAPATPHAVLATPPSDAYATPPGLPRSPSHNLFTTTPSAASKGGNIRQLSTSTPTMTAQAQSPEPPSPKGPPAKEAKRPHLYKARQKKFNRNFPTADSEVVLNYYSCALIGDILLQGHLYITRNYFAFYSNVFGYVTKLLIPMQSVQKITKEKTARIIPNAVGIATSEEKHVFGSLMSRDSTYRFMNEVLESYKQQEILLDEIEPILEPSILGQSDSSDSSATHEGSGRETEPAEDGTRFRKCSAKQPEGFTSIDSKTEAPASDQSTTPLKEKCSKLAAASRQNLLLIGTTLVLVLLFLSASVLLYRIGKVQNKYTQALQDNFVLSESDDVYGEILQWQTHLHSKSAGAVHSFLDNNLDQIAKVRQSLEALSTLLISPTGGPTAKPVETPENS